MKIDLPELLIAKEHIRRIMNDYFDNEELCEETVNLVVEDYKEIKEKIEYYYLNIK